jgi:hypothetical protein
VRFVVYAEATREFYDTTPGNSSNPKYKTLQDVTNITAVASRSEPSNPRITVTLDNRHRQTQGLFRTPPIGYRAEVYDGDLLFEGTVDVIRCGDTYEVQVQA